MKLKNYKAQSRRNTEKPEVEDTETYEEIEETEDGTQVINKVVFVKKRKRCKMFTQEEQELLQALVEKYNECLDTSQTRDAIRNRKSSWQTIHDEFNAAGLNISRDLSELKIKYKNMKSNGTSFSVESKGSSSMDNNTYIELHQIEESPPTKTIQTINSSTVKKARTQRKPIVFLKKELASSEVSEIHMEILPDSNLNQRIKSNIEVRNQFENETDDDYETEDDLGDFDFVPTLKKSKISHINQPLRRDIGSSSISSIDRDETRLRKENLLLKNACLRKKERLLELQIALAERNLRRHELQI